MNKKDLIIKLVNNESVYTALPRILGKMNKRQSVYNYINKYEFTLNDLITICNSLGYKLLIYLNDDEYINLIDEYNNSK